MKSLLNIKLILTSVLVCLLSFICFSCNRNLHTSNLNQITGQNQTCTYNDDITEKYYKKYHTYFSGNDSHVRQAIKYLSQVPEDYLINIFIENKAKVKITSLSSTFYSSEHGRNIYGKTDLKILSDGKRTVGDITTSASAFTHEFGHDSFSFLASHDSSFTSELEKISNIIIQKYKSVTNGYLNSFDATAKFRLDETLAALFSSWYCSETARTVMKKDMLEVYEFAQKYLLDPEDSAYQGKKKNVNIFISSKTGNSFDIYVSNNSQSTIKYCIGSDSTCSSSSSHKELSSTKLKNNIFIIPSVSLDKISKDSSLHIYDTQSTPKLLRNFYVQKN